MQPFDKDRFDKRYTDILEPAIRAAGLDPYRVDRDPSVSIPIDDISNGLKRADLCLADITIDNPNVWFELGFAIASNKEVVLICSNERTTKFPFDVQHRSIIQYETQSPSDFQQLSKQIIDRIKALHAKEKTIKKVSSKSPLKESEGLKSYEIAALALVLANCPHPGISAPVYGLVRDMEHAGYTDVDSSLGIRSMLKSGYIEAVVEIDPNGDEYQALKLTDNGFEWLMNHQDELKIYIQQ
jgi:hypothetical protein